ncbi:MAG: glycosyltransferase family 4 protein [Anaerolineae bacterium]|nr:glycosyltransferase family 4 protein [Anaerolineae bacterium]
MRILIINSEYPPIGGGAGNASAHLARELVAAGQDVQVLTAAYADLPSREARDGVVIQRIWAFRRHQDRSSAVEQIIFMLVSTLRALFLLPRQRPDAIVAFFGIPSGLAAWAANLLAGVPYIVSLRGGDVPGFRPYDFARYHRLAAPLIRMIWRRAQMIVANSAGLAELARAFEPRVSMQIIPNGVDLTFYTPTTREWNPPRLLFVGRLVYQKGLDLLFKALAELRSHPWELCLVGDGPQRPRLESFAEKYQITARVRFANWLDGPALLEEYHQSNLFVFPSRHEGMPNAVLEAMACGLPVIASRIAGNEELVVNGETGLLIPPEDVDALQQALTQLLSDADLCQRMGAAGRQRVEEHYAWNQIAAQYLELIGSLSSFS